jgi:hypothetical protein
MSNFSEFRSIKNTNKKDLLVMYGGIDLRTFEGWIDEIKPEINWRKGKQVFPPRAVQRIIQHIGQPFEINIPK